MTGVGEHHATQQKLPPMSASAPTAQREISSIQQLLNNVSDVLHARKSEIHAGNGQANFHAVDVHMEKPAFLREFAAGFKARFPAANLRISALHPDQSQLDYARNGFEAQALDANFSPTDYTSTPAANLRNGLGFAGGADLVLCAHAAYPHHLPNSKFIRAVDRLSDITAENGALVTVHHHGSSDVDGVRRMMGIRDFSKPGMYCATQQQLESKIGEGKMHSFSVTVPNIVQIPNDREAIRAVFNLNSGDLEKSVRNNAAKIWDALTEIAGGKGEFHEALHEMSTAKREAAARHLIDMGLANPDKPIGINHDGAQVVMAFHRPELARAAFETVQKMAVEMSPPALVLPISQSIAQGIDKHGAHDTWRARLREENGISTPPMVCQKELDRSPPAHHTR